MADIVCIQCKYIGRPGKQKRGSGRTETIGWMIFPFGLPYTIWRMITKKSVCRHCGSDFIKPVNSLAGQRLVRIINGEPVIAETVMKNLPSALSMPPPPIEKIQKPQQDPNLW